MTMHALDGILVGRAASHDLVNEFPVATKTSFLQDLRIARLYQDGLMKVLESETL